MEQIVEKSMIFMFPVYVGFRIRFCWFCRRRSSPWHANIILLSPLLRWFRLRAIDQIICSVTSNDFHRFFLLSSASIFFRSLSLHAFRSFVQFHLLQESSSVCYFRHLTVRFLRCVFGFFFGRRFYGRCDSIWNHQLNVFGYNWTKRSKEIHRQSTKYNHHLRRFSFHVYRVLSRVRDSIFPYFFSFFFFVQFRLRVEQFSKCEWLLCMCGCVCVTCLRLRFSSLQLSISHCHVQSLIRMRKMCTSFRRWQKKKKAKSVAIASCFKMLSAWMCARVQSLARFALRRSNSKNKTLNYIFIISFRSLLHFVRSFGWFLFYVSILFAIAFGRSSVTQFDFRFAFRFLFRLQHYFLVSHRSYSDCQRNAFANLCDSIGCVLPSKIIAARNQMNRNPSNVFYKAKEFSIQFQMIFDFCCFNFNLISLLVFSVAVVVIVDGKARTFRAFSILKEWN